MSQQPKTSMIERIREIETTLMEIRTKEHFGGDISNFTEEEIHHFESIYLKYTDIEEEISCLPGLMESMVMNEETLMKAVLEQAEEDGVGAIVKAGGIRFHEVLKLSVDFKGITMIDHLWDFTSLTQLCLSNNFIEKIERLDRLINLTELTLSFNRIGKIEGLDSLQKLELLDLTNNKICVIENMDKLEKLAYFFIANNCIDQLDNVLYLRRFKNLYNITISGNPFSTEDDYKLFIAAYFPDLKCIDYRIINGKTRNEALIKYKCALEKIRRKELEEQQAINAELRKKAELQLHTDAFVEFLNGSHLFKSMFEDDPEADALLCLPETTQQLQKFEDKMVKLCTRLFEIGLDEHKRRETEVSAFLRGRDQAVKDNREKAFEIIADFKQQHIERIKILQQLPNQDKIKHLNQCSEEVNQLSKSLMLLEFQLDNQVEDIIKRLDDSLSDMVGSFSETAQGIFAQCRELEDKYYQSMEKSVAASLEYMAKEKAVGGVSHSVRMVTVMDALSLCHHNHLMKIDEREKLLVKRLNAWKASLMKEIKDNENKRNRMHHLDDHKYVLYHNEQLKKMQQQLQA